jgi:hypothetical protein
MVVVTPVMRAGSDATLVVATGPTCEPSAVDDL